MYENAIAEGESDTFMLGSSDGTAPTMSSEGAVVNEKEGALLINTSVKGDFDATRFPDSTEGIKLITAIEG